MSSSESGESQSRTSGGERLRQIREEAGRTQLWVELEAELGTGYLQRLESGRVVQPERGTLVRILDALEATYNERQRVMRRFGYQTPTQPPSLDEIIWARDLASPQLEEFPFPAYALDCLQQLVCWNGAAETLLDLGVYAGQGNPPMLAPWFDPESHLGRLVVDPDAFLTALITAYRYEARRFREESWSEAMTRELRADPRFERYWQATSTSGSALGAARALLPLRLRAAGGQTLSFRLSAEPYIEDERFRVIYYFPDNTATMIWFDEKGRESRS